MRPIPPLALLGALLTSSCAQTGTVSLQLRGSVRDALVTVDDQVLGPLGYVEKRGVALPPGTHRLTVERAGYFPFDQLVVAEPGTEKITVVIELEKIPD